MNVAEDVPRIGGTGRLPRTQCINNTQADRGSCNSEKEALTNSCQNQIKQTKIQVAPLSTSRQIS